MSLPEIHVDNIGTIFRAEIRNQDNVIVDLSAATTLEMRFRKPDRATVLIKTAVVVTDGSDGQIQYITIAGDLDVAGPWIRQARVVIPAGEFWTEKITFDVKDNI